METNKEKRDVIKRSQAFRSTNDPWNDLALNQGWSIGMVMNIAGSKTFSKFEDWESYYLKSGEERKEKLKTIPENIRTVLEDLRAHYVNPRGFRQGLEWSYININDSMGRTLEDLKYLAVFLYDEVVRRGNPYGLTLEDCVNHTYIRVIDESFVGILREANVIESLRKEFPGLVVKKTSGFIDRMYAVDAEIYNKNKLLCGIQIKSPYFIKGKTEQMKKSHEYNQQKMVKYRDKFSVHAHYVCAEVDGEIINQEVLNELRRLI